MNPTQELPFQNDQDKIHIGASVICRRTGVIERRGQVEKLRRKEVDLVSYVRASRQSVQLDQFQRINVKPSIAFARPQFAEKGDFFWELHVKLVG